MANVRVRIEGIDQMLKNSKEIYQKVTSILGEAVKEGADIVRDAAKANAPVKTGNLRKGIVSQITWDKGKTVAFAGAGMDKSMNSVFVRFTKSGKRYYYPTLVEYGHKGAAPHSYLRPALDGNKTKVKKAVADRVKAAIDSVCR